MGRDLDLVPNPTEVAALVDDLVGSEWPTSEAQRLSWFHHHELDVRESHFGWGGNGSDSFVGAGPERWGGPRVGWHTFDGAFVGISWLLWHGAPPKPFGWPLDSCVTRSIDMYLHGGHLPDGSRLPDSVVQLHVDHAARSRRADEAAARAQAATPPPWDAQGLSW